MTAAIRLISGKSPTVLEFFAGIGLARAGLEQLDFRSPGLMITKPKSTNYTALNTAQTPTITLATSPTSMAAIYRRTVRSPGLPHPALTCPWLGIEMVLAEDSQERFGTLCGFSKRWVIVALPSQSSKNVTGLASSHSGDDLTAAIRAFNSLGYSIDALSIDARHFIPQSRATYVPCGGSNSTRLG